MFHVCLPLLITALMYNLALLFVHVVYTVNNIDVQTMACIVINSPSLCCFMVGKLIPLMGTFYCMHKCRNTTMHIVLKSVAVSYVHLLKYFSPSLWLIFLHPPPPPPPPPSPEADTDMCGPG